MLPLHWKSAETTKRSGSRVQQSLKKSTVWRAAPSPLNLLSRTKTNLSPALSSPATPGFICHPGCWETSGVTSPTQRTATAERWELISQQPGISGSSGGDSVTPGATATASPAPASPLLPSLLLFLLALSSRAPGVLSVPDSYQLTLKHKRVEERERRRGRQRGGLGGGVGMETQTEWVVMDAGFHHL